MQYRQKLLSLIFDEDDDALFNWISAQPVLDRVDIFKEYKELAREMLEKAGEDGHDKMLSDFEKNIDEYLENYLDQQVINLKYEIVTKLRDESYEALAEKYERIILRIKECIETNAPNAEQMKAFAKNIIKSEKENGFYDPLNWLWFTE